MSKQNSSRSGTICLLNNVLSLEWISLSHHLEKSILEDNWAVKRIYLCELLKNVLHIQVLFEHMVTVFKVKISLSVHFKTHEINWQI